MRNIERRAISADIQVRSDGDTITVRGYAAVFDSVSHAEVVRRGAFNKTLAERDDVRLLINHDGVPLARSTSGTLSLGIDERGLWIEASLDQANPTAQELVSAMQRGDLDQMSFAFIDRTPREQRYDDDGVRNIREVQLFDVSVVTFPWYEETSAELNALALATVEARGARTRVKREDAKTAAQLVWRALNGWTYSDAWPLLYEAVSDAVQAQGIDCWWLTIYDISDTWLVFLVETMNDTVWFQCDYDIADDGTVTLGEATPVIPKTDYLPKPNDGDADLDDITVEAAGAMRLQRVEAAKALMRRVAA